jgi:hypothetical protein
MAKMVLEIMFLSDAEEIDTHPLTLTSIAVIANTPLYIETPGYSDWFRYRRTNGIRPCHIPRQHSAKLKGKRVILIGDNNDISRKHMETVESSPSGTASVTIRVLIPEPNHDVPEFLQTHSTRDFENLLPPDWLEKVVRP